MRRRQYLGAVSIPALLALTGSASAQTLPEAQGFEPADVWVGPIGDRPDPGWVGFDNADGTVGYIASDTGEIAFLDVGTAAGWQTNDVFLKSHAESELPPPGSVEGQMAWNSDRKVPYWYDGNDIEYPVVGDDVLLSSVSVSNTTTETDIWDAGIDSGSIKVGRVYVIKLYGIFSTSSTSDNVTVRFYIGGVLVAEVTSTGKNSTDAPWSTKLSMTVREEGANGTVEPYANAKFNNASADDAEPAVTVDTTVPEEIQATAQWNNAKTDNTFTIQQGYMKEVS